MLDEIYERDESLTEDEYYEAIEFLIGDAYPHASEEELEDILEEMLENMPEQYADAILGSIGKVAKDLGSGALKFAAKHPQLIKGAATIGGSFFGGPLVGGKIGNKIGGLVTSAAQKKFLPETGKALAIMQNPSILNGMARATLGIGNGTAPVNINGNNQMVALGIIIRTMMYAAQNALKELHQLGMVPQQQGLSESMPFGDDPDAQAEWLSEQLIA